MNNNGLSNIKSNLSVTYVRAIAAKLNFAFLEGNKDVDGIGIDCIIFNEGIGLQNKDSASSEIHLQVKAFSKSSLSMYKDGPNEFKYRLDKNLKPKGAAFYLVVVELPEEEKIDEWVRITNEELILKRCAYFIRIKNETKAGFIKIPKTNRLTNITMPRLFIPPTNKESEI